MAAKLEILLINNNCKNIINSFSIIIVLTNTNKKSLIAISTRDYKIFRNLLLFSCYFSIFWFIDVNFFFTWIAFEFGNFVNVENQNSHIESQR